MSAAVSQQQGSAAATGDNRSGDAAGRAIPRIIHQIWLAGTMPEQWAESVERLKADNPGWEHRLYDETAAEAFIGRHYGAAMLATYRRIDPRYLAARADLFRYLVVHQSGGVYLDVKSGAVRPLDEIVRPDDHFLIAQWRNEAGSPHAGFGLHGEVEHVAGGEFQQWHVIGAPQHPFLAAVIERVATRIEAYRPWREDAGWMGVLRTTGPIPYTLAIAPMLREHPCRLVANEEELGLLFNRTGASSWARPGHYTRLEASVVRQPWPRALAYDAYRLARRAKRGLRHG